MSRHSSPALPPMRAGTPEAADLSPLPAASGGERPSSQLPPRSAPGGRGAAGANGGGADRSAPDGSPTNHAEREGVT